MVVGVLDERRPELQTVVGVSDEPTVEVSDERQLEFRIFGQMALGFFGQMVVGVLDKPRWASSEHGRVVYHFTVIIMVVL